MIWLWMTAISGGLGRSGWPLGEASPQEGGAALQQVTLTGRGLSDLEGF